MKFSEVTEALKLKLNTLYDNEETLTISRIYFEERFKIPFHSLYKIADEDVPESLNNRFKKDLSELADGRPLQYVLGYQWFFGRTFTVNESVLIPRPETEELVSIIVNENKREGLKILDIGTGSGCIPISLKLELSKAEISATDISLSALETAKLNANQNNAEIRFLLDDIITTKIDNKEKFDIIVSNPPYISTKEASQLAINVVKYEPHTALFAPENDPVKFYRAIIEFAAVRLNENGILYLEINPAYGGELLSLLKNYPFGDVVLRKDLSGNDRFIRAVMQ